jgi:hypothetical protein
MSYDGFGLRDLPPDDMAPVLGWDDFLTYALIWKQNQHLALIGPTEQGKTNTLYWLLDAYRKYVAFFSTKIKDETLNAYIAKGTYSRCDDWPPWRSFGPVKQAVTAKQMPRRLVWPDATSINAEARQIEVFNRAIADIYRDGGWCPVWDDYWYLVNILGLSRVSKKMLLNARSNNIPFALATQRVAGNNNVEIFDQSTHLMFFRDNDERNLKTIGGVGWLASGPIRAFVANLDPYQSLYVNTRSGHMYRTTAPELKP